MGKKRVTLADVASAAQVSPATVSLVLTDRGSELRISEPVQAKVRETAQRLGYRPNAVSVGLRKGTTRTLGFISDNVATSQLAGNMIRGALEAARQRGFMLFIAETEGDSLTELALFHAMMDRQVDGIILATMFTRHHGPPEAISHIPTVLLNNTPRGPSSVDSVMPDEIEAGRAAASLLLEAGHRKIHLLGAGPGLSDVPPDSIAARERLQGILDRLNADDITPASYHMLPDWIPSYGRSAMLCVLEQDPDPQAIICFNDRVAFAAYQVLDERGLRIPDDVSVVSIDDYDIAGWLRPGLSTFAIPHADMGRRAVELLLDQISRSSEEQACEREGVIHRVHMPLHERESVGKPRG